MPSQPTNNMVEAAFPLIGAMPSNSEARAKRLIHAIYRAMWDIAPRPTTSNLTRRQSQVQEFLAEYINSQGKAPKYSEIAKAIGVNGRDEVYQIVMALERKGVVKRLAPSQHRALQLLIYPGEYLTIPK